MTGRPPPERLLRGRLSVWPTLLLSVMLAWASLAGATGNLSAVSRVASAAVQSAPAHADAADFVPSVGNLPPGFREDWTDAVGGDLEPTIALKRAFVALDESRRLVVGAAINASEPAAQAAMDDHMNQLTRFQGWRFTPNSTYGDSGYRGSRVNPDGGTGSMMLFRVQAVTAEIGLFTRSDVADAALVDNVAQMVAARIETDPGVVAQRAGWPTEPVTVPGKEPEGVALAPGSGGEVTGTSSGSPVAGDTIVLVTLNGIERPWTGGGAPRPPAGMEYITVDIQIDVVGPTEAVVALPDFTVITHDARFWSPVNGRSPGLRTGAVSMASPASGWLTFQIPVDQPALQLTWRLRTSQPASSQGGVEQTIVVPLFVGATATASIGTAAPPASNPVPPPGTPPGGPSSPAPPGGGGGGGGGGGSGGGSGGGPRLQ